VLWRLVESSIKLLPSFPDATSTAWVFATTYDIDTVALQQILAPAFDAPDRCRSEYRKLGKLIEEEGGSFL